MDLNEREKIIYRIQSGILPYYFTGKNLEIRQPTLKVKYDSCDVYDKILKRSLKRGLLLSDNFLEVLKSEQYWTELDEKQFAGLPSDIDKLKIALYETLQPSRRNDLRNRLKLAKDKYKELLNKKHHYDYLTADGIAYFAKTCYILQNSTFYRNRPFKDINFIKLINYYYDNMLIEEKIREIAHTAPWESLWTATKGSVFRGNLSYDQQRLMCWSRFYDNIRKSPDCPNQSVIDDDDMLDGWVLLQRKEKKDEKQGDAYKHKEVFLMANSEEDIKEIYNMNDALSRQTVRNRFDQVRKEGEVNYANLKDVKLDNIMKKNRG